MYEPLRPAEQAGLEAGLRSPNAFTLRRSQILLASHGGQRPSEIARNLDCATQTVSNTLHAFEKPLNAFCPICADIWREGFP